MKIRTFTLRPAPDQRHDKDRVKRTVDVIAAHVVSLHDPSSNSSHGVDIALDTGGILCVEDGRSEIRAWLEQE